MSENSEPKIVADDVVVTMEYTLTVDGEVVDSSEDNDPIEFLQGYGAIIPGLEKEIYGMAVGESKSVNVNPAEGYGDFDSEAIVDMQKSEFPEDIPMKEGVELQMIDEDGEELVAVIVEVGDKTVKLDFNHPLAGKELHFDVKITGLRTPTEEELEHGHVHFEDEEFDDEFDFDEDEDEDENGGNNHHH